MKTIMKFEDLTTIDQLENFLSGTQAVAFSVISDKDACYRWIQGELVKFRYLRLSRQGKGAVILSLANCYSSRFGKLIEAAAVSPPTEFVQLDWQFGNDASYFSRRITAE
jgi:hypothetical protein